MMIASALPLFEQGIVEKNGNTASWVVIESNIANEKGRRMHHYQCLTINGAREVKKSGRCSSPAEARRSAINQCKKLLDKEHASEILNPN